MGLGRRRHRRRVGRQLAGHLAGPPATMKDERRRDIEQDSRSTAPPLRERPAPGGPPHVRARPIHPRAHAASRGAAPDFAWRQAHGFSV
jgi:hypothetical protein